MTKPSSVFFAVGRPCFDYNRGGFLLSKDFVSTGSTGGFCMLKLTIKVMPRAASLVNLGAIQSKAYHQSRN